MDQKGGAIHKNTIQADRNSTPKVITSRFEPPLSSQGTTEALDEILSFKVGLQTVRSVSVESLEIKVQQKQGMSMEESYSELPPKKVRVLKSGERKFFELVEARSQPY